MRFTETIRMLQSGVRTEDAGEWRRKAARAAWVKETCAAWREAQRRMDERCCAAVERLDCQAFERLCDEEEAKVDLFRKPLKDAAERDLWPPHLYWGNI